MSEHLAELVESGWIAHEGEYFSITERGSTSLSTLSELVDQIREQCGENLSEDQYATTVASLEQMARNLGWEPQTSPETGT
ncbi:Transcriptional regulator [Glutamicibacter creatinolyticus]|uniref:Transcriptional regulator n=1 Tax=Glutamicibacter creatinolyticus TaxID=162496 RepID=A0A5B7WPE8_9MICC|nr:Transcriptional regulator [Glutamicibacter creatinolyticus]